MTRRGWEALDVILVTGDAYIDSPLMGVAVIGRWLEHHGFRVGVLAQPDPTCNESMSRLGEPRLFWGVTGGAVDSMVANFTATGKRRRSDDFTPGAENTRRPDRAVLIYANAIRRAFKPTCPIVLGGIEASLRRVAHYDAWSDRIRRSILIDAKADALIYGMGERAALALARALQAGEAWHDLPGLCYAASAPPDDGIELPSFEVVNEQKQAFVEMFRTFYAHCDPVTAQRLYQRHAGRVLIQNPPAAYLTSDELDAVHRLEFEQEAHPRDAAAGPIRALDTIRFSIVTHRGCYGECNFCAIAVHQGRHVRCRSEESILSEARSFAQHPRFRGIIPDVGGPTANMYGTECSRIEKQGTCPHRRCMTPRMCPRLPVSHRRQRRLLSRLRALPGVRKVFIASGVRYDLVLADHADGEAYLSELLEHHISGQMKVAPEHTEAHVLELMGKPDDGALLAFLKLFRKASQHSSSRPFLTYYLIAAHPGCTAGDMDRMREFVRQHLKTRPEQVQVFTPTPSTWSSLMYYTEWDPFHNRPCFVEKGAGRRMEQKRRLMGDPGGQRRPRPGRERRRGGPPEFSRGRSGRR